MQPSDYVREATERLRADGSEVSQVQLPSGLVTMGYRHEFRLSWAATKLHLFTVIAPIPQATADGLQSLIKESVDYAKRTKGQLRGFQTGVAVIPALVAETVLPDARALAESSPKKSFAAINLPVVVDLGAGSIYTYRGRIVLGAIYAKWLRERIAVCLLPPS